MKIQLANGTELQLLMVAGTHKQVYGAYRDCLSFIFDDTVSMDEIDSVFTEQNCESVVITGNDGSKSTYDGYTIRAELRKSIETLSDGTASAPEETVNRIYITMAQRTYSETKLAENISILDELLGGN